ITTGDDRHVAVELACGAVVGGPEPGPGRHLRLQPRWRDRLFREWWLRLLGYGPTHRYLRSAGGGGGRFSYRQSRWPPIAHRHPDRFNEPGTPRRPTVSRPDRRSRKPPRAHRR